MLLSGFDLMPGDGTDAKTFGYLLEHSRLWLLHVYPHDTLWDAPFYYPLSNTLALSDAIIGIMPIYWISRLFLDELSSIQAVFIIMSAEQIKKPLITIPERLFDFSKFKGFSGNPEKLLHLSSKRFAR